MKTETPRRQQTVAMAEHTSRQEIASAPPPASPSGALRPIKVSFTTFIDFVAASSAGPRMTVARNAASQLIAEYHPRIDFHKQMREAIVASAGSQIEFNMSGLPLIKQRHYPALRDGWNKFVGRKKFESAQIKRREWVGEGLVIRVNPEIALVRNGICTYYKLFFKADDLKKGQVGIVYQMMHEMLINEPETEALGLLHVRKGKVIPSPGLLPDLELSVQLRAEAAYLRRLILHYLASAPETN